ncbi:hypothetical protein [Clostridiisalibacter paucivorans]|uniref:hypothetical protein n=1 Tax=Clostridiisalibacter paucivorans TaxID=408753 RepID=UPI00047DAAF0|nr:hypothetical protein [Clostridiisalibacter paucivorans]
MKPINEREREFIDGVWNKVRYLEYQRNIKEDMIEDIKRLKQKRLKIIGIFILGAIIILMAGFVNKEFSMGLMSIMGIYLLGFSSYYENYLSLDIKENRSAKS